MKKLLGALFGFICFILVSCTDEPFLPDGQSIGVSAGNISVEIGDGSKGITIGVAQVTQAVILLTPPTGSPQTQTWRPNGPSVYYFTSTVSGLYNIFVSQTDTSNNTFTSSAQSTFQAGYNYYIMISLGGNIVITVGTNIVPVTNTNHNPVVNSFSAVPSTLVTNTLASLQVSATDIDGDALSFSYSVVSGGGTLSGSDASNGKSYRAPSAAGTAQLSVTVSDGRGGLSTSTTNVTIVNSTTNLYPSISSFTINPSILVTNITASILVSASDADGDALSYSYSVVSGGGTLSGSDTSNGKSYRAPSSPGAAQISVTVSDGKGGTVSRTTNVTIVNSTTNLYPILSAFTVNPSALITNQTGSLQVTASDPDGDTLTYSYSIFSGGGSLGGADTANGKTFTAPLTAQTVQLAVNVSDGKGGNANRNYTLSVTNAPVNNKPVIASFTVIPSQLLTNQTGALQTSASDPDGDTLSYSYSVLSGGGTLGGTDTANGKTFTAPLTAQTVKLTVTVSDGKGGTSVNTNNVVVTNSINVNQNPVISSFTANKTTMKLGETVTLSVSASDPDAGNVLSYSYSVVSGGGTLSGSDTASGKSYRADFPWTAGAKSLRVTVSDGAGGSATADLNLTVVTNDVTVLKVNEVYSSIGKDFFEIRNNSGTDLYVQTNTLYFGDSSHASMMPAGTKIPANGFLVVYPADTNDPKPGATYERIWSVPGSEYGLGSADSARVLYGTNVVLDSYSWTSDESNVSQGRLPDGTGAWDTTCNPTIGAANQDLTNRLPVILSYTIVPSTLLTNQSATLLVSATDPDNGDTMSFSFSVISGGGTLSGSDTSNGKSYRAPLTSGIAQVRVTVSDGHGGTATQTNSVTNVYGAGNQNPVISSFTASKTTMKLGETVTLSVSASDPDAGNLLSYSYSMLSGGGSLGGSDTATGKNYRADSPWTIGTKSLRVTVTDGAGGSATANLNLTVATNDLSVLKVNEAYSSIGKDFFEIKNNSGSDFFVQTETLYFGDSSHASIMPAGTKIPANSYLVVYPGETNDPKPGAAYERVWSVPGSEYGLGSADSARILFGTNVVLDSYSWTSDESNVSQGRLPDGTGAWDTTCNPTIGAANQDLTNRLPVLLSFTVVPSSLLTNQVAALQASAIDPDTGDTMSYSYSIVSGGGTLSGSDTSNGKSYRAPLTSGSAQLSVTVSDGHGGTATRTTNVTIVYGAGNRNPVISSFTANLYSLKLGQNSTLSVSASDPDAGQTLSYSYQVLSGGGKLGGSTTANETFTGWAPWTLGTKTVRVTVSDGNGGSANADLNLTVISNDLSVLRLNEAYSATGTDYFEVKNISAADFYTETNSFKFGDSSHAVFMPAGTLIPANSYLVIFCNDTSDPKPSATYQHIWSRVGEDFGLSSADSIRLLTADSIILDTYSWTSHQDNVSQSRLPDGTGAWDTTCTPTPGLPNLNQ